MQLKLFRLTPTLKPKPMAFADFTLTFSGGESVLIKGVQVKFYKSKMQIILPKLKHLDPKKKFFSPFLFTDKQSLHTFMNEAEKQITTKYPLSSWGNGIYDGNC